MNWSYTMNPWAEYTPTPANPWDLKKAGHLYRRAAFGATHAELTQAVADGPKAAIDRLLKGGTPSADFDKTSEYMAGERSLPAGSDNGRLAAWWLWRIQNTAHPLHEKLCVFWHNHFATSNVKVQNARFMLGQYKLIARHALGDFRELLHGMSFDPAMLVWLDAKESKKGKPNENYARELMELFSLGLGHYTEADIREAARAFTGYDVAAGAMKFDPKQHDPGEKDVFGKKGAWKGDDVVKLCLDKPACPAFIVTKLYRYLVNEAVEPTAELIAPLAEQYRASGFDTAKLVETILRSEHFFAPANYRQRVKPPVEFAVGIVRGLEGTAGPQPLAEELERLGQALFAPPSVKGWDGGPTWLNAQTLLFRQNLALALTSGEGLGRRCDPAAVLAKHGATKDAEAVQFLLGVFHQHDVPAAAKDKLLAHLADSAKGKTPAFWSADDTARHRLRTVAHLTLTLPEFQLA
jgi:uncharacterized protein (DUF1800 family)